MKRITSLLAAALCLLLCACGGSAGTPEGGRPSGSAPPAQSETAPPVESNEPEESAPAEEETPVLPVDGEALPAEVFESTLGYSMTWPPACVDLRRWEDGENFELSGAPGSYLSVSLTEARGVSEGTAFVQFEYAVEDNPVGCLFGAEGYAGVKMTQTAGDLTTEYILYQHRDQVYLVELSVFGEAGRAQEGILRAMLDTLSFD